jgi:hypothetical protein
VEHRGAKTALLALVILALCTPPAWSQALPDHPSPVPIAEMERGVDIVYAPPGCLGWGQMNVVSARPLFAAAQEIGGTFYFASSGWSGLLDDGRALVPEVETHDARLSAEVLAPGSDARRLVLEPSIPVLVTPYDVVFQYPHEGHVDWIEILARARGTGIDVPSAGSVRVSATLVRYTLASGAQVLSVEFPGAPSELGDLTSMSRVFAIRGEMLTEDDAVDIYLIPRPLYRGARAHHVLATMISERAPMDRPGEPSAKGPAPLFLHPGGVIPEQASPGARPLCAEGISSLSPTAIVPRRGELSLGPEALTALAGKYDLPYLAANLTAVDAEGSRRPFKRFLVEERGGIQIAVIGLVGDDMLADLPVGVRSQWKLDDPLIAFQKAREALDKQEGRRPDLTVLLVASGDGATLTRLEQATGADVVIGNFQAGLTQMGKREHHEVIADGQGREGVRYAKPLVRVTGTEFGVGRISARFGPTNTGGRARLSAIVHESRPVRFAGPIDASYGAKRRRFEETLIPGWSQVLLPDVAPIVQRHRELQDLVYGDAVLSNGRVFSYPHNLPAMFTDRLWMRLVTNILKEELGGDVAVSQNLQRSGSIIGPLQRFFVDLWLQRPYAVRVVRLNGTDLLALSARLAASSAGALDTDQIMSAGLDPAASRVGGRPIDPKHTYRVVVTDQLLSTPELAPLFAGRPTEELFQRDDKGVWRANEKGRSLTIKDVVGGLLEGWLDPQGAAFDPKNQAAFEALLLDHSARHEPRWHLQVEELSVRGSSLGNTSNVASFAASKETRVNTPEHFSIGFKTNFALQYDGPDLAWDNRVTAQLQRQEFSADGEPTTVQEAADDLVLSSELRFNSVKIDLGTEDIPLVPYLQASYDTEFTAIELPTDDDPGATLPHQHVVRAALGQIVSPGTWLKEVRLGALFQEDFSEQPLRWDAGLVAGAKVELSLLDPVLFKSQLDIRYLFPDQNDTESDLGFVLTSVSQLVIPLTSGMNLLLFADYYLVQGKLESNSSLGGSQVYGLGLDFARYFRL